MTASPPDDPASPEPHPEPAVDAVSPSRPGTSTFTIEGRAAPGLFVLGWLASIAGLGIVIVGFQAGPGGSAGLLVTLGLAVLGIGLVAGAGSQALERRAGGPGPQPGAAPGPLRAASGP